MAIRQLKSHNPLQRRPFTPAEYAQLHHTIQSKATVALKDLGARLEAELAEARAAAERELKGAAQEVEELERGVKQAKNRIDRLRRSLRTKRDEVQTLEELREAVRNGTDRLAATRVEARELAALIAAEQSEVEASRRKLRRVRSRRVGVEEETAAAMAPMDAGTRRLLDAENEVIELSSRRRNTPDAVIAAVSA